MVPEATHHCCWAPFFYLYFTISFSLVWSHSIQQKPMNVALGLCQFCKLTYAAKLAKSELSLFSQINGSLFLRQIRCLRKNWGCPAPPAISCLRFPPSTSYSPCCRVGERILRWSIWVQSRNILVFGVQGRWPRARRQLHNAWGNIDVEPIGQIQLSQDNINHNTHT